MCGFTVIFKKRSFGQISKKDFFNASLNISHRGPDDRHHFIDENIMMDFFRLNILDLSKRGRQPMESFSGRYMIVFNGEIYNKDELKNKIKFEKLKSTTDTEILINLFEKYKFKMMNFLEGMFSFVIYDKKLNKIYVGRDRFGIKPLFYSDEREYIIFSSELKPILKLTNKRDINDKAAFNFFFNQTMDSHKETFFNGINNFLPASIAEIDKNNFKIENYWKILSKNIVLKQDIASKKFSELFENSINQHLNSDVEIGLFLSGGTDSTILAKYLSDQRIDFKTYTYDFVNSGKYGESKKAKQTSKFLGLQNFCSIIKPDYIINNYDKIIQSLESPFTSIRLFGDYKLYEQCKINQTKVILLGQGGDEIFSGYSYNTTAHKYDLNKKKSKKFNIFDQINLTKDGRNYLFSENFNQDFVNKFSKFHKTIFSLSAKDNLKKSQELDIKYINLPRSLKYSDRLSMNFGVEARIPYLNHKLAEFGFNLDARFKYSGNNQTRSVLKNYVVKNKISKYLTKTKKSIADPQREWFRKELKDFFYDKINSKNFINSDIVNQKGFKKNYENLLKGKINTSFNIFQIISFVDFKHNFQNFK